MPNADIAPSGNFAAVTPHDTTELPHGMCRGIYVGVTGNVAVQDKDGTNVVFVGVPAGTILPVKAKIIRSTSTTATSLIALF